MDELMIKNLFSLNESLAGPFMEEYTYPWEVLPHIGEIIRKIGESLDKKLYTKHDGDVWIAKSVKFYGGFGSNVILGPTIIGENTEVRPGAFIRGNVLVGDNCVVGNSTELKNVILFNNVQVPHYNYVGDSILGYRSHMGAGSITSNVKADKTNVYVKAGEVVLETGLRKFGAMLGDNVEVGCNSVLNPGSVIGRETNIYPLSMVRGFVPEKSIYKKQNEIVGKH
ncbi:MAG: UDP-N-acetylglucosamine pyrophosphorylase [Lachnospiraceae bacterium]|nr:UDP-N-acetylglucosamine pyrophosphorylase [Lachnospiraceae bacterium]MBR4754130.1 UDP-N-acetylglucosamine pyrophosphorylase [Lachnospiraceae bacterium]MBR4807555.1 UDP-N-acetylglucosamine pyrophosphorylase [Lachnospiraceae bacterium]